MLTSDEIRHKAEAMERLATTASEAGASVYREMAMHWRLLEIEADFMEAMRRSIAPESNPPPESAPA